MQIDNQLLFKSEVSTKIDNVFQEIASYGFNRFSIFS